MCPKSVFGYLLQMLQKYRKQSTSLENFKNYFQNLSETFSNNHFFLSVTLRKYLNKNQNAIQTNKKNFFFFSILIYTFIIFFIYVSIFMYTYSRSLFPL